MRSKEDWYKFLKYTCKYLSLTLGGFIKDFLGGKKHLIPSKDVNQVNVPQFPELSVSKIFPLVKSSDDVMQHLDYYSDSPDLPEKWYFYSVVGTVAPDYLNNIIQR